MRVSMPCDARLRVSDMRCVTGVAVCVSRALLCVYLVKQRHFAEV